MCCTRLAENTGSKKIAKKSPSRYHRTNVSGCIFATKACIDNRKKFFKQQYLPHLSSQYGELQPTNGWDPFGSLGHPSKFQRFRVLAALLHGTGRQPNFAALNRGRHLYSAGRPRHGELAHILGTSVIWFTHHQRKVSGFRCSCHTVENSSSLQASMWSARSHLAPNPWEQCRPTIWFLGPTEVLNPNGNSIASVVLQGSLVWQTDRPTVRLTDNAIRSVTIA